jgi:hypothetical protein
MYVCMYESYYVHTHTYAHAYMHIYYLYFIYTEDDAELDEIIDFGLSQGDPYRTFEAYLRYRENIL